MLKKILIVLMAASMTVGIALAETSKKNITVVYVQNAQSSALSKDAKQPGVLKLTLHKPELFVSYFSDRPERLTGMVTLNKFLSLWGEKNKARFSQDPPNVAIETNKSSFIGMLSNPVYNSKTGDVTFTFKPINAMPSGFKYGDNLGYTILFIDDVSWDPGGFGPGS